MKSKPKSKFRYEFKMPKKIEFDINEEAKASFIFSYRGPGKKFKYELIQNTHLFIEPKTEIELTLEQVMFYVNQFNNLITVGIQEPTYAILIKLRNTKIFTLVGTSKVLDEFYLNYPTTVNSDPHKRILSPLFLFYDIKRDFKKIVRLWFEKQDVLEPVMNILMDTYYRGGSFNENVFLNIVQALETFHRRTRKNFLMSKVNHDKRIKEINDSIPTKHKVFLSARLMHSNEPSLKMRLEKLMDEFSTPVFDIMIKDRKEFIRTIRDNRNYYTHYDISLKSKALKPGKLYDITEKLKVLLICAVLKEVGFSMRMINKLLDLHGKKLWYNLFEIGTYGWKK